mmetsp:Transcript_34453/g.90624  ORF Transcript_34453/g.90624 Transcript_34453/m.90624 type:complete len:288 (+) Transcript_34453:299-1162(+)
MAAAGGHDTRFRSAPPLHGEVGRQPRLRARRLAVREHPLSRARDRRRGLGALVARHSRAAERDCRRHRRRRRRAAAAVVAQHSARLAARHLWHRAAADPVGAAVRRGRRVRGRGDQAQRPRALQHGHRPLHRPVAASLRRARRVRRRRRRGAGVGARGAADRICGRERHVGLLRRRHHRRRRLALRLCGLGASELLPRDAGAPRAHLLGRRAGRGAARVGADAERVRGDAVGQRRAHDGRPLRARPPHVGWAVRVELQFLCAAARRALTRWQRLQPPGARRAEQRHV